MCKVTTKRGSGKYRFKLGPRAYILSATMPLTRSEWQKVNYLRFRGPFDTWASIPWAVVTTQVPFVLKTNPLLSPNSWRQFQLQSTVHFPLSSEIASSQNFSNQGRFKIREWGSSKTWTHAHTGARELEEARTLLRLSCLRTLPRTVLVFCFVLRHLCSVLKTSCSPSGWLC